ncbi:MAG: type II toxin-antitoxin system RelE/ParE family toxin [Archangium sp.]
MIKWSLRAQRDLRAIGEFIAADDPRAAFNWVVKLQNRAIAASRAPGVGRVVPEIRRADVREVLLKNYRIVYRVERRSILVLTVFEGHRLLRIADID